MKGKIIMEKDNKKKRKGLDTFGILLVVLLLVAVVSWLLAGRPYTDADGNAATVVPATFANIIMAPIQGFHDAGDVIGFVFVLGAFLGIVNKTGALETGIQVLVKKNKGHELRLIWVLMFIFSACGTTYGMCEETVGFYILLAATMYAAGMDPIVGCATVLLGAGVGCLGSTINPFATGAAIAAAGVDVNTGITITLGIILWLVSYFIAAWYVTSYAKKVIADKGSSFLSMQEMDECNKAYGNAAKIPDEVHLTSKQKSVLWLFALTFAIMIIGFVPWVDLGVIPADVADAGTHWSAFFSGNCFGYWWFDDAATWFLVMGVIIGLVGVEDKAQIGPAMIAGFGDMISVNLVIALARATSVLMKATGLGTWLVQASVTALSQSGMSSGLFAFLDYLLHIGLSFLVPSSSGLAGISSPIVSPIVSGMGWSVETSIMIFVAANGLVNLITPTCGAIMGGLALARVQYSTWVKWSWKCIAYIGIACAVVLTGLRW
jgi:uncharacterized ion transporter superfamily protein YfcC